MGFILFCERLDCLLYFDIRLRGTELLDVSNYLQGLEGVATDGTLVIILGFLLRIAVSV